MKLKPDRQNFLRFLENSLVRFDDELEDPVEMGGRCSTTVSMFAK